MNEQTPFQYSILRYTNDVETGEILNIGLAVFSPAKSYFRAKLLGRYERLTQAFPGTDGEYYRGFVTHLQALFDQASASINTNNQLKMPPFAEGHKDIREILGKVLVGRDSAFQFAEPKFGVSADLDETTETLFDRYVSRYIKRDEVLSREDPDIWMEFRKPLLQRKLLAHIQPAKLQIRDDLVQFDHVWRNGRTNILYPQSFDLMQPDSVRQKAYRLIGLATVIVKAKTPPHWFILMGRPLINANKVEKAYQNAKGLLAEYSRNLSMEIIEEVNADEFANRIEKEVRSHSK